MEKEIEIKKKRNDEKKASILKIRHWIINQMTGGREVECVVGRRRVCRREIDFVVEMMEEAFL